MKITRFHATADGESRFQEIEVPINERRPDQFGHTILQSGAWASPSIRFVELPAGLDQSWHHAPARQIVVVLSGATRSRHERQSKAAMHTALQAGRRSHWLAFIEIGYRLVEILNQILCIHTFLFFLPRETDIITSRRHRKYHRPYSELATCQGIGRASDGLKRLRGASQRKLSDQSAHTIEAELLPTNQY